MTTTEITDTQQASSRALLVSSTTAFVLAAMVAVTLHELAHAVAGLALGLTPTVSTNSVSYQPEGTPNQEVITAAAGPLFSLVLGAVLFAVSRSWGRGVGRLFWMWLALISGMNFVGYLIIAPLVPVGDSGRVLAILQAPGWVYVAVVVVGVLGEVLLGWLLATQVVRYGHNPNQLRGLGLFAWLIGTLVVVAFTVINLSRTEVPAAAYGAIAFGAATVGIFAPLFTLFWRRVRAEPETLRLRRPGAWIGLAVLVELILVVWVAPGLRLG